VKTRRILAVAAVSLLGGVGCSDHRAGRVAPAGTSTGSAEEEAAATDEAARVLRRYLEAENWADRLRWVYSQNLKQTRARMEHDYRADGTSKDEYVIRPGAATLPASDWTKSTVVRMPAIARRGLTGTPRACDFYLVKTDKGFLVDWEASRPYEPMTLAAFAVSKPAEAILFRVEARSSETFAGPFADCQKTHLSLELTDQDEHVVRGYLPRNHRDANSVRGLVSGDKVARISVVLQQVGPNGKPIASQDADGHDVAITRVVSDSWVVWDDESMKSDVATVGKGASK
jgi:hypothetical protein